MCNFFTPTSIDLLVQVKRMCTSKIIKKASGKYCNEYNFRRLKIIEKVSFNIASEASYVYILSGQKCIINAKKCLILASF